jgi:hypothetical protein
MDHERAEGFFLRNLVWLQKKEERLAKEREERDDKAMEYCTFQPETHGYSRPEGDARDQETENYKIIFNGRTFDLTSERDLEEFFQKSILQSGQRSIFKRNNDNINKIYQEILK